MVEHQPRTGNPVSQLDRLLNHPLWHDSIPTGLRTLGVSEDKPELIVEISRTTECVTEA